MTENVASVADIKQMCIVDARHCGWGHTVSARQEKEKGLIGKLMVVTVEALAAEAAVGRSRLWQIVNMHHQRERRAKFAQARREGPTTLNGARRRWALAYERAIARNSATFVYFFSIYSSKSYISKTIFHYFKILRLRKKSILHLDRLIQSINNRYRFVALKVLKNSYTSKLILVTLDRIENIQNNILSEPLMRRYHAVCNY